MANHIKPTAEELEASSKALAKEAEELMPKDEGSEEPTEVEKDENEGKEQVVFESEPEVEKEAPEVEEKAEQKEVKPEVEKEDYKTKFIHSTKEAQMLYSKNKKLQEAFDRAGKVEPPTEEELEKEFSDWDIMSDLEKKLAKDNLINKKRFEAIEQFNVENQQMSVWESKVDEFITDPNTLVKYKSLDGKEDEFKLFASKDSRRGNDFDDIVSAFLYKIDQVKPVKNKGKMMESGTGGASKKAEPVKKTLSVEEGRRLRKRDYSKWKDMLRAGKIDET
jgi:hypothetical protein